VQRADRWRCPPCLSASATLECAYGAGAGAWSTYPTFPNTPAYRRIEEGEPGNQWHARQRVIERICQQRLGIGKAHVLRYSFARALEDAGAKASEIQARLGHESLAKTGCYLAALRADENRHADALAALFGLDTA
jgi:integrase